MKFCIKNLKGNSLDDKRRVLLKQFICDGSDSLSFKGILKDWKLANKGHRDGTYLDSIFPTSKKYGVTCEM